MKKIFFCMVFCFLFFCVNELHAQEPRFNQVIINSAGPIFDMVQDKQGLLWIATITEGLKRYDGINFKTYTNDPRDPNSLASGPIFRLFVDPDNILWMGISGSGLEKFDPATNTFTHFRHDPKNASSLISDTVGQILEDHLGNLWVGTVGGLDMLDRMTGKFIHYRNDVNDPSSLSPDEKKKQMPPSPKGEEESASYKYEPVVTVTTKRLGPRLGDRGKIEIRVADNGNGIPQKVLDKIFQPFFTTKPTGQGTGLGLSLSYDIVKAHGGELK